MTRVLVLANEHVNQRMAGPSIRSYELSRVLHESGNRVTLASPFPSDLPAQPFRLTTYDDATLPELLAESDVVVLQGWVLERFPAIRTSPVRVVIDLYDPFPLEVLILFEREPLEKRRETQESAIAAVSAQVARGDFFMCASERQLDFWAGWLTAMGRVNPLTHHADPTMRSLIDVVPFGLSGVAPVMTHDAIRATFPRIAATDVVLLWGGGIYNWFDPVTLIRAVGAAVTEHPEVRLVFMSTGHPNPDIQQMWTLAEARRVAEDLGLTGTHVFFNETWVPYENRADWFLAADIGVSCHFDHVETRYSFRTRILDHFWAGLPTICTSGDTLADVIEARRLGLTVPPQDEAALAVAIGRLAGDAALRSACSARVREYARGLTWEAASGALVRYCATGAAAPDRSSAEAAPASTRAPAAPSGGGARDVARSIYRALPEGMRRSRPVEAVRRALSPPNGSRGARSESKHSPVDRRR